MIEVDDWRGMGTFVGKDLDAGVEGLWPGEREDPARAGLVTVGSRKEKKLWDNECLCYSYQLLAHKDVRHARAHMMSSPLARFGMFW